AYSSARVLDLSRGCVASSGQLGTLSIDACSTSAICAAVELATFGARLHAAGAAQLRCINQLVRAAVGIFNVKPPNVSVGARTTSRRLPATLTFGCKSRRPFSRGIN